MTRGCGNRAENGLYLCVPTSYKQIKLYIMKKKIKFGVIRETKNPPDKRVPVTPPQAIEITEKFPNVEVTIQPSDIRCYNDTEYSYLNQNLKEDLSDCDILIGVKEVDITTLIPDKKYIFFAHVAKKQPYNRKLLQEVLN